MNIPQELLQNPHFSRYFRTWQKNEVSLVFLPLAQICREQGRFQEALEICEKGLTHHPNSVSGRLLLARIYFDLDQTEEAKSLVEEILQEFPGQREAKGLLGQIARCRGGEENDQRQEKPKSLWENVTMAQIYADQGETPIALGILEKILSRDPGNERALRLQETLNRRRVSEHRPERIHSGWPSGANDQTTGSTDGGNQGESGISP